MFGIPTLLNKPARGAALALIGNAANLLFEKVTDFLFGTPKWGIYVAGTQNVGVYVSSVVELEVTGESMVSDYQIETGSFVSYNKVLHPNIFVLRFTQDGFESQKAELLQWCEDNVERTELYDVVCPEKTWTNATLIRYRNLRAADSGAGMVTVECMFQQVRELPAQYTNTKTADPENEQVGQTVRVNPIPERTVTAVDLGPLQ